MPDASGTGALLLHYRVSQFIFRETRLLDEQRWGEWEQLFAEGGEYWAPASENQPDPKLHVSLIYETELLRKVRIARFRSPAAYSLQPFPRTSHLVSNVMADSEEADVVEASARFLMSEYRRDKPNFFSGAYHYRLVRSGEEFRIALKKATLVNCDGALPSSSVYF